jgi:hypothetical protein
LELEFNSLDAQRESGEAYIASQQQEGWTCLPDRYDDGGFTGGNLERPAVQRLLADIQAGKIDCVVVYKVDRLPGTVLTRNYKRTPLQVKVLQQGFEFAGHLYPSLTAVAKAITGSHCNGFLFFGLVQKGCP